MVFAAVRPDGLWFLDIAIRTRPGTPPPNGEMLRRMLAGPFGVTAATVSPAGATIRSALQQPRTQALMFGTFAVVALLLAALGLYAVTSFDVALRQYELGIRSSLGASASTLRRLVVLDAVRPVLIGTAIGIVASYWISRWVQTLVYDVNVRDPWTFALVAFTLVLTAAAASWFPARRAARVDPADVLRAQ
jgi:putative ABC transport system permease protein